MTPFDVRLPIIANAAKVRTPHVFHVWHCLKEMGAKFHVEACAQFMGLEARHIEAILSSLREHDCWPIKSARSSSVRGTRLPNDWTIPDDWVTWASTKRKWHPADVREEADKFARYWQSKSGAAATKVDWFKTFQNWVSDSRKVDGDYQAVKRVDSTEDRAAFLRRSIAYYEREGRSTETEAWKRELASIEGNVLPFERKAG